MATRYTPEPVRKNWLRMIDPVKRGLTTLGRILPGSVVRNIAAMTNYVQLGRWMQDHDFHFSFRSRDRDQVFGVVADRIKDKRVLYLEFGVFQGASMRFWSAHLNNSESQLHGFDSFEGLPESGGFWDKGEFNVNGQIPRIDDDRVQFHKGWFDQVLPGFKIPDHDVLVINIDADLYSSTIFVLQQLKDYIRPGSFIFFDDLPALEHEPRAIHEFLNQTGMKWQGVSAHVSLGHAFFECVSLEGQTVVAGRIAA